MKVFIFNSLPRTGKDTSVELLHKMLVDKGAKVQKLAFKDSLVQVTARFLGLTDEGFLQGYDKLTKELTNINNLPEWYKDVKMYRVGDLFLSKREALIHVSEDVIKPLYGENFFGKMTANKIDLSSDVVLISDGGFIDEVQEIVEHVAVTEVNLVRLNKDGSDGGNDSRNLLTPEDLWGKVNLIEIDNNGTLEELADKLKEAIVDKQ